VEKGHQGVIRLDKEIVVAKAGPYIVCGHVPLVYKTQIVSEYGEPLTWKWEGQIETPETYRLCRCGQSSRKPFCDGRHATIGFDGTETADTGVTAERGQARSVPMHGLGLLREPGHHR
jgi:CDGSH-type Zn-finger protein